MVFAASRSSFSYRSLPRALAETSKSCGGSTTHVDKYLHRASSSAYWACWVLWTERTSRTIRLKSAAIRASDSETESTASIR